MKILWIFFFINDLRSKIWYFEVVLFIFIGNIDGLKIDLKKKEKLIEILGKT